VKWICCQLGAREHFAIPRALFRTGLLEWLLTDAWIAPQSFVGKLCGPRSKLKQRFHNELRDAPVKAFTSSLAVYETLARARGVSGWTRIIARDRWFQRKVVSSLRSQLSTLKSQPILLSYSYTALEPFRYAKANGWKTILVQIDPGPQEESIVAGEAARVPELAGQWQPAPAEYWGLWSEECKLADRIVVNSEWAQEGLIRGGILGDKISVIPLAYEPEVGSGQVTQPVLQRKYPARFTFDRPLRVLFLGLINLRKGAARLLEAARTLRDEPVEFWMVGPVEIGSGKVIEDHGRVKWFGPITRKQAAKFYRDADVFILPTLSDGFAITQLEAQAYGLPIIASKYCGRVVENGVNGILLDEPSPACIAHAVRDCIANPGQLQEFADASQVNDNFALQALAQRLKELPRDILGFTRNAI
jgi:glycosyltransferase involved in cell wall biosynthesis